MSRRDARCIAVALSEGRPLTVNDLRRAAVRVDDLLAQTGLSPRILECYLSGEKRSAWSPERCGRTLTPGRNAAALTTTPAVGPRNEISAPAGRAAPETKD